MSFGASQKLFQGRYRSRVSVKTLVGILFFVQILAGCGAGRGSGTDVDGNPVGLGLNFRKISGDNQKVKRGVPFPIPLVARIESPDNTPVPEMRVTCSQISSTDGYFTGPTTFYTDRTGTISTTVHAPSTYDQVMQVECRVNGTPDRTVFTLETVFVVDRLEFVTPPPATYTAHHTTPMSAFEVHMIDTDNMVITITGGGRHWIDMTLDEASVPALLGDTQEDFTDGIATFSDVRYIRAGTYTLRATHNRSGKSVSQAITVQPNTPTQILSVLPGQSPVHGVMTLAEALTGSITSLNVDSSFNVNLRAVDDYFNLTSYAGTIGIQTPNDATDTEPGATSFVSGEASFTVNPVQAKNNYLVRPVSDLSDLDSTSFTMAPGAPAHLIARLPEQTYDAGQTSLASAVTGAPSTQAKTESMTELQNMH